MNQATNQTTNQASADSSTTVYYEGRRWLVLSGTTVIVRPADPTQAPYELPLRLDLRRHSPTGFAWGYSGSGPAQLALALLADHLTRRHGGRCGKEWAEEKALTFYQRFKELVVANLSGSSWVLTSRRIDQVLAVIEQEAGLC